MIRHFIYACLLLPGLATAQDKLNSVDQAFYADYEARLHDFHREVNTSLELRKDAMLFYNSEMTEGEKQYFTATDILLIQSTVARYAANRQVLLNDVAYRYRDVIKDVELILRDDKPTQLQSNSNNLSASQDAILYINPNDETGIRYIRIIKLGLSAALTLYDNFIIAIMPYQENGHFRRSVNYDNIDNRHLIESISGNFRRLDNYKETLRVVEFNNKLQTWSKEHPQSRLVTDKDISYFNVLINGSYTNRHIKNISFTDRISFRSTRLRRILQDFLFDSSNETMSFISQVFGNSMGLIETRSGYLKNIPRSHKKKITKALKAGDILLEKTPFRLTDRFIPGHWGHVAIWVGNEQELKSLGVWKELPALYKKAQQRFNYQGPSFQALIRNNHKIVEALRPGVQLNSLEHFLNIDDLAVLRSKQATEAERKRYVLRTFAQVGKDYDFNFDVETDTRIVCSELAFVAYDDYHWSIEQTVGRYTITPDHIGEKAKPDGPLDVILLYHNGKRVNNNLQTNFTHLMRAEYVAIKADLVAIVN